MRIDVDDIEPAERLHPSAEWVADRVVAADRNQQRPALGDRPGGASDAPVVRLRVRALDRDIADVRHRHADQVVPIGFHVIPALGARVLLGPGQARVGELRLGGLTGRRGPAR